MENTLAIYKCEQCGNVVQMLHATGPELTCCSEPMKEMFENTVDASKEKHVPVITKTADGIKVTVGSVAHPMEEKHYIQFIEVIADNRVCRVHLKPGDKPEATFNCKAATFSVREYCNLHGLWQAKG